MLKFRISKTLINDDNIAKCAILEDETLDKRNRRRVIHTDNQGREYFHLPNKRDTRVRKSFVNRIADAVDEVVNGDGDAISVVKILGVETMSVLYFLDREYGESLKENSIKGWKDTKFGWAIKEINTFSTFVSSDKIIEFSQEKAKFFANENDALSFIDEIYNEAYEIMDKGYTIDEIFQKLEEKYGENTLYSAVYNVISSAFSDNDFDDLVPKKSEVDLIYQPIQVIGNED